MKKLMLISLLLLAGCAFNKPSNNYQYTDLNVIIVPKDKPSREITVTKIVYGQDSSETVQTFKYVVPNLFYPNDSQYICSGTKAKSDFNTQLDDISSTVKTDKCK